MLKMSSFTSKILELSIAATQSGLSNKTLGQKLKYYEITFYCIKFAKLLTLIHCEDPIYSLPSVGGQGTESDIISRELVSSPDKRSKLSN